MPPAAAVTHRYPGSGRGSGRGVIVVVAKAALGAMNSAQTTALPISVSVANRLDISRLRINRFWDTRSTR